MIIVDRILSVAFGVMAIISVFTKTGNPMEALILSVLFSIKADIIEKKGE